MKLLLLLLLLLYGYIHQSQETSLTHTYTLHIYHLSKIHSLRIIQAYEKKEKMKQINTYTHIHKYTNKIKGINVIIIEKKTTIVHFIWFEREHFCSNFQVLETSVKIKRKCFFLQFSCVPHFGKVRFEKKNSKRNQMKCQVNSLISLMFCLDFRIIPSIACLISVIMSGVGTCLGNKLLLGDSHQAHSRETKKGSKYFVEDIMSMVLIVNAKCDC